MTKPFIVNNQQHTKSWADLPCTSNEKKPFRQTVIKICKFIQQDHPCGMSLIGMSSDKCFEKKGLHDDSEKREPEFDLEKLTLEDNWKREITTEENALIKDAHPGDACLLLNFNPPRFPPEEEMREDCTLFKTILAPCMKMTKTGMRTAEELCVSAPLENVDAIIIMGNNDLKQVTHMWRLWTEMPPEQKEKVKFYISGKGGHGTIKDPIFSHTEAETMQRWLVSLGVPNTQIVIETEATNSGENVKYLDKLIPRECHTFLMSGTPAGIYRQIRTFAKQWQRDGEFLTSPPLTLDEYFSPDEMQNFQTEILLCSFLREHATFLNYLVNTKFVTTQIPVNKEAFFEVSNQS